MASSKTKIGILLMAVFILAGAAGGFFLAYHQHTANPVLPRSAWNNAGYKDPVSTIKTMAWAANNKDATTLYASLSPDCQEWLKQMVEKRMPGAPPEQFLSQMWSKQLNGRSGIRVVKTEPMPGDKLLMDIALEGGKQEGDHWIGMRKVEGEWKFDDFNPKGK